MNRCTNSGGQTHHELVTFNYQEDDRFMLIENVPAEVCEKCGERTYTPEVTDALLNFAKKNSEPAKFIEVPVFNYAGKM